ncbi:hypothetical protein [Thermoactinospora rubra]|uniref:hypothetical protein n=1 Tax=Thermoactinospora rubra TaxID=1088767 RepID=UPI001301F434|nr:hypothetical protein [Thermoactinospora rubra]
MSWLVSSPGAGSSPSSATISGWGRTTSGARRVYDGYERTGLFLDPDLMVTSGRV